MGLISIGGGEALLRKELILQISDYLSGNNSKIDLALVTNGYLMTKEYASQLRLPNIRSVQVSLDGFKENHERMRNMKGSYDRAIESIKYNKGSLISNICIVIKLIIRYLRAYNLYTTLQSINTQLLFGYSIFVVINS